MHESSLSVAVSPEQSCRWPNLYLVGAPRGGTTALSHYLAGHPRIYMSEQVGAKEPGYFDKDLGAPWNPCKSQDEYLAMFRDAPEDVLYRGEATARYLYSRTAIPDILQVRPDARFVVTVRNPIDLVQSLYGHYFQVHNEDASSFPEAWALQQKRLTGQSRLPVGVQDAKILQYGEIAKTGAQLARALKSVARERMHVVVYDDFVKSPRDAYLGVLRFLGLEDDGRGDFPVMNERRAYRFPWLQTMLGYAAVARRRLHVPGGWGINALIDRFNEVERHETESMTRDLRNELIEYFRADVMLLSDLLHRDLSHWLASSR